MSQPRQFDPLNPTFPLQSFEEALLLIPQLGITWIWDYSTIRSESRKCPLQELAQRYFGDATQWSHPEKLYTDALAMVWQLADNTGPRREYPAEFAALCRACNLEVQ